MQTEQVIRDAFQGRVEQLTRLAEYAATDTSLVASINLNGISDVRKMYQILDSYRIRDDQTLDLVDLQGNVLAWKGPA
jgi:hypothetical protein